MRVLAWGTYDRGKPRMRILLRGLEENGVDLVRCHADIWSGVEDKSTLSGWRHVAAIGLRLLLAYPRLVFRYLRAPRHDIVLVGYLGHLDILVLWPFAKLRGVPIVWDAFISLYDTVAFDRAMIRPSHPFARLLFAWEWLACRAADCVLLDTRSHADFFVRIFGLAPGRTAFSWVGVEPEQFPATRQASGDNERPLEILFYGQFIPLHGIETIIEAAAMAEPGTYRWTLVGRGQETAKIRQKLAERPIADLAWAPWIAYEGLKEAIARADICLGIFGSSDKAARVIPNKVFQALASQKPLLTRDSPAIRELLSDALPGVYLVPPGDPAALLDALRRFATDRPRLPSTLHLDAIEKISPASIGHALLQRLRLVAQGTEEGAHAATRAPS